MNILSRKSRALGGHQGVKACPSGPRRSLASQLLTTRPEVRSSAALERIIGFFGGFVIGSASESASTRNKLRAASSELLQLLSSQQPPALSRVDELVDDLISAEGQPFQEKSLGGGPWVVRYTRGKPLLWNFTYSSARLVNSRNRAAQEFDPANRAAVNLVEINGPTNRIEAYGTYQPLDDSSVTPKAIRANITSGRLILGSWELPLPISGTGEFEVMYVDNSLRVFRSNGRFAVQVCADRLPASQ